jgi:hypothetical protein
LFFSQVELCDNLIFHRRVAIDKLGERLLDANRTIGQPDKITVIFGHKITKLFNPHSPMKPSAAAISRFAITSDLPETEITSRMRASRPSERAEPDRQNRQRDSPVRRRSTEEQG